MPNCRLQNIFQRNLKIRDYGVSVVPEDPVVVAEARPDGWDLAPAGRAVGVDQPFGVDEAIAQPPRVPPLVPAGQLRQPLEGLPAAEAALPLAREGECGHRYSDAPSRRSVRREEGTLRRAAAAEGVGAAEDGGGEAEGEEEEDGDGEEQEDAALWTRRRRGFPSSMAHLE